MWRASRRHFWIWKANPSKLPNRRYFFCQEGSMSESKLSRRNFLLTVGASGAVGAATLAAKAVPQAQPVAPSEQKRKSAGYQDSAHIRNYYRTAKVGGD